MKVYLQTLTHDGEPRGRQLVLETAAGAEAVKAALDGITATLKKGGEVRLVGFGTFAVNQRAASEGRNPRTGAKIKIKASKQPKFKAGKVLKDAVN